MSERKTRILGRMMSQYIGKEVVVGGHLTNVSANGDSVEITTFDKVKINVTLPNPLEVAAEGILEVWGTVKSKGTIEASQCIHFDEENSKDFDTKGYNDMVIIHHANADNKYQLNNSRMTV